MSYKTAFKVGPAKFLLLEEETMCHGQPVTGHTSYSSYSKIFQPVAGHTLYSPYYKQQKKKIQQRPFLKKSFLIYFECTERIIWACFSPNSDKYFNPQPVLINNCSIGKQIYIYMTEAFPKACLHRSDNKILY